MFALVLLAGCESPPLLDSRPVVDPFRDCLYTYYEQRETGARPDRALLERRAKSGGLLIAALERAGERVSEAQAREGLAGIAPAVERFLHTQTADALAVLDPPARPPPGEPRRANDWPGSYLVMTGVERFPDRDVDLGRRRVRYHAIVYERALVLPYARWHVHASQPLDIVGDCIDLERRGRSAAEIDEILARAASALR